MRKTDERDNGVRFDGSDLSPCGSGERLAGTADGGCIFRLVVSRFNRLQRRCRLNPQQDPHTNAR
jgi:hypothetical protein